MCDLVCGSFADSVRTMLNTNDECESKCCSFGHGWLFKKGEMIVSALDTKVNVKMSLHAAMLNYMLMKKYPNETNGTCLKRFRSMTENIKLPGGEHILVSETLLGKKIEEETGAEINAEQEKNMAANRYSELLKDLNSSANRDRDEHPITLTDAFDLLVH